MKFEIGSELMIIIHDTLKGMGVPDTIDNRQKLVKLSIDVGLSQLYFSAGIAGRVEDQFPGASASSIGPVGESDEDEPEEQLKLDHAPDPCPWCGKTPRHNGREWGCNCRTFSVGPKPISPCPHCGAKLRPNHYYWECDCNRYDESPEVATSRDEGAATFIHPKPTAGLSNSFPE